MKTYELKRREGVDYTNYVKRYAEEGDYKDFVSEPTLFFEDGQLKIAYISLPDSFDDQLIVKALNRIKFAKTTRSGGLVSQSRTIGYLPRVPMRKDYCTASALAYEDPKIHKMICNMAKDLSIVYKDQMPEEYHKHWDLLQSKVLPEYHISESPFTSGIINKDNRLKYHFDAGNFKDVFSCMVAFKDKVVGGHLSLPEYNLGIEIANKSLLLFDGQSILHGVTEIKKFSPYAHRYTIVFYSMQQMWNCDPLTEEVARVRNKKLERERKRLDENRTSL